MKLFAQHGAQEGAKIDEGIEKNLIDGVIFSPKDVSKKNLLDKLNQISKKKKSVELFLDPQLYACLLASHATSRLGKLLDDYAEYFTAYSRSELEREQNIIEAIKKSLQFQCKLQVTGIIAPNIHISRSFDSIEAVIAKNFIRNAAREYSKLKDERPLYASIIVSRDALTDKQNLQEFLNEITMLESPPAGYYIAVSANSTESRAEIFNGDTIAGWMLMNHSLTINGFKVINGYSDIASPFLGVTGAYAGSTGWFSNLRAFSMGRFSPVDGGRLPVPRYLSNALLNRITFHELDVLRKFLPDVCNNLPLDSIYDPNNGSEPQRNQEVLQSWEALKELNKKFSAETIEERVKAALGAINRSHELYGRIAKENIALDTKSNDDHLEGLEDGIYLFSRLAEIPTE